MPGDTVFVLSDLHFNAIGSDRRAGLVRFLQEVVRRRGCRLYLNGDILDYVRGDRPPVEEPFRLFQRTVDQVRAEGIPVTYVIGNHDLPLLTLLRPRPGGAEDVYADREPLELAPGLTLCYRRTLLQYEGRRVHIEHGHLYDPGWLMTPDQERSLYRPWRPPGEGTGWMEAVLGLFSTLSGFGEDYRGRRARTGSDIPPVEMARYAVRRLEREDAADWYVFGHFHAPTLETLEDGRRYLNTGDSVANGGYGALSGGQLRLGDWRELLAG